MKAFALDSMYYLYLLILMPLSMFGMYRLFLVYLYFRHRANQPHPKSHFRELPRVTVQLPVYNEYYVIERLIRSVCALDYPTDRLEIQVLDDSTDETRELAAALVSEYRAQGIQIRHLCRPDRREFKAGALAEGLKRARGDLIAIFDADFVPLSDFLRRTVHYFTDPQVGLVQTRWGFLNEHFSRLTRVQAVFLNGHFILEHTARNRSGRFFNFNGTAGIWRKAAILDAGGWQGDTLTEDLDLSYRAQMRGWRFVYLPEVVSPSELPVEINALKNQQSRWSRGMIQCAFKLLPRIWRSREPLRQKIDATFHLTSSFGYLMTAILSVLVVPTIYLHQEIFRRWPVYVILAVFSANLLSVIVYYVVAERQTKRVGWAVILDILSLVFVGVGLSLNGARAAVSTLLSRSTPFVRTPKYRVESRERRRLPRRYRAREDISFYLELLFALYYVMWGYLIFRSGNVYFLPALLVFGTGYLYLIYLSLWSRRAYGRRARGA